MNAQKTIDASWTWIGNGTHRRLNPVVTAKGRELGWRYSYPEMLNLNGVNYSRFTTLDQLIEDGVVELKMAEITLV